jgi:hypothetical protein
MAGWDPRRQEKLLDRASGNKTETAKPDIRDIIGRSRVAWIRLKSS